MGILEKKLPKIVKNALKEEDKITTGLVNTLLTQVLINQNKTDPYPIIRRCLDDEIDKSITTGLIDIDEFEGV